MSSQSKFITIGLILAFGIGNGEEPPGLGLCSELER
jgi:hypothetical protein